MDLKDVVTEFDEQTFLSKINRLCRTKDINAMRFKAYLSASNYEDKETAKRKTRKIVSKLNANNKSHSRHFTSDFCKQLVSCFS